MTDDTVRPPIPTTCEHRPTVAGVVIPWGNVQFADGGADFRVQHESWIQRCWLEGLCQLCGLTIPGLRVLFGGPNQVAALQFDEPPMHPECAVYASRACPMVAGRLSHYATRDVVSNGPRGKTCFEPGCDCGGWVPHPGLVQSEGGDPAHDWYAVYTYGIALAVSPDRPDRVHSCVVTPDQVVTIRHMSTPGVGRTWRRMSLADAGVVD
ncbi:hypothetical protein FZI85_25050 [Mycobacterium sp. CBMA293]|uniref:hypothetical protein n=1 Tax=unclassified Mycolicibacterium TaxID=2636767 RepID=UPI0012DD7C2F|nr:MULTISPECIES: hypothetical protein [unclassified Mycolicibacterium]MUL47585.1 hypothetical protein [Mycolicibacterium sp. CBMA 360]MUL61897.1 hypothetical protein [Mycolicibacterium sp. CBMA 335]MUL68970.1 hypothetical protein [Mycolicibacterium sp. CBMA 311]MUL92813.1 hypothetical protein [Mycolicibacterium sp. CBMA 230]MUM08745.1 hypothetical protein [Mycolicibacterium sp. CBMA 213]